MARGPDPDLIGARRRILDREHRLETAETLAAAYRVHRRGVGDAQETILRRLVDMWDRLPPPPAPPPRRPPPRPPAARPRGGVGGGGAAPRRYRAMKADLNRQIHRALEDCADRIDGTWEPAPRCPRCSRSQRRTARVCDRDGTPLGPRAQPGPVTPDPETDTVAGQGPMRGRDTNPVRK